jgi:hypothetical protein
MKSFREPFLLPCPFCGGAFSDLSYDRRIVFACEACDYQRTFPGLLTLEKNDHPIKYQNGYKPITQEYYHFENSQKAINEMNKRAPAPARAPAYCTNCGQLLDHVIKEFETITKELNNGKTTD